VVFVFILAKAHTVLAGISIMGRTCNAPRVRPRSALPPGWLQARVGTDPNSHKPDLSIPPPTAHGALSRAHSGGAGGRVRGCVISPRQRHNGVVGKSRGTQGRQQVCLSKALHAVLHLRPCARTSPLLRCARPAQKGQLPPGSSLNLRRSPHSLARRGAGGVGVSRRG
jgi:hypothetical protein